MSSIISLVKMELQSIILKACLYGRVRTTRKGAIKALRCLFGEVPKFRIFRALTGLI